MGGGGCVALRQVLVGCDESNNSQFFFPRDCKWQHNPSAMCDLGIMELEFCPIQLDIWSHFGGITAVAAA